MSNKKNAPAGVRPFDRTYIAIRIIHHYVLFIKGGLMAQYYQSKRLIDCQLPRDVFKRMAAMIEGYPRMKTEAASIQYSIIHSHPHYDSQPKEPGVGDPTANKAIKLARITEELDCIERTVKEINSIYARKIKRDDISSFDAVSGFMDYGYYCFALYDPASSRQPARRTWSYFKTLFAYKLAENLNLI